MNEYGCKKLYGEMYMEVRKICNQARTKIDDEVFEGVASMIAEANGIITDYEKSSEESDCKKINGLTDNIRNDVKELAQLLEEKLK